MLLLYPEHLIPFPALTPSRLASFFSHSLPTHSHPHPLPLASTRTLSVKLRRCMHPREYASPHV